MEEEIYCAQQSVRIKDWSRRRMKNKEETDMPVETTVSRSAVGDRIRKIRTKKGVSREDLGNLVGLGDAANRIQQYENGARKPKRELLSKIADALDVSPLALEDPDITTPTGFMYAIFEMEARYGLTVDVTGDNIALIAAPESPLFVPMAEWYLQSEIYRKKLDETSSEFERDVLTREYQDWKYNFESNIREAPSKEARKLELKAKMAALKKEYEDLP